uniref:Uncharacterized protein n=1 Tax=Oryza meridionalis TaxID=40149 RepID=A0A0E0F834_9ORYZ
MLAKEYKMIFSSFGVAPSSKFWKVPDSMKRLYVSEGQYNLLEPWSCSFLKFDASHVVALNKKDVAEDGLGADLVPRAVEMHRREVDPHGAVEMGGRHGSQSIACIGSCGHHHLR